MPAQYVSPNFASLKETSVNFYRYGRLSLVLTCCVLAWGRPRLIAAENPQPDTRLTIGGFQYILHNDRLRIVDAQESVFDVCLSPVFDGKKAVIRSWKHLGPNHFEADLGEYGKALVREMHGR